MGSMHVESAKGVNGDVHADDRAQVTEDDLQTGSTQKVVDNLPDNLQEKLERIAAAQQESQ